jgi:DNA-binding LacI/PurR family transcriptional regulator
VFRDAGPRVPESVSVIGFDDIQLASYWNPTLTTLRQPLQKMGEIAAHEAEFCQATRFSKRMERLPNRSPRIRILSIHRLQRLARIICLSRSRMG